MDPAAGFDIVGPKAYVGRPQGFLVGFLAIIAIVAIYWVDVHSPMTVTLGALVVLPVLATAWLAGGRITIVVTAVAVGSRLLGVGQGELSPTTAGAQTVVLPVVALIGHLAARGLLSAWHAAAREHEVRDLSFLVTTSQAIAASLDLDSIIRAATQAVAQVVRRGGAGGRSRAAFHELIGDGRLRIADDYDEAGSHFSGGEYPMSWNQAATRAVARNRLEVVVEGDLAPELLALAEKEGWRAGALAPVRASERLHGLLIATARDRDAFRDEDLHLVEVIAQMTSLALGHAETLQREREEAGRVGSLERTKAEFLRLASHELRGPLTVIRGYLSMILDGSIGSADEATMRPLRTVQGKVGEMDSIITQMLEAARLEDSSLLLKLDAFDLADVIEEAVPRAREPGRIKFRRPEVELAVNADRDRTLTILGNLLDNAIKYSPGGGDVTVTAGVEGEQVVVGFVDHGIGIADKDLGMLFTRFGRVVPAEHAAIAGTGLGLYLCRELARRQGGDVTVESELGRGSTFTLRLPLSV
ncbi:MAG TPA: HAMP domain-containing sensor histidine kinase [Candidatus Dormibacteraeota bacterium]|jgi:signal transduction histidine kinase